MISSGCSSGAGGNRRYPGVSGESVLDRGEHVDAVLAGGGCVAANGVAMPGGGLGAEPTAAGYRFSEDQDPERARRTLVAPSRKCLKIMSYGREIE